nr:peptidoglycan-associated lipoprotein Pal [Desulfobacterales bacterium]
MYTKLWLFFILTFVASGLLFTTSCAKKVIKTEPAVTEAKAKAEAEKERLAAERERQAELERERALEEQRLKEEELKKQEEELRQKERFTNEDIHFDFDKYNLTEKSIEILKFKADWLLNHPGVNIIIEGHCDERGTNEYNLALGERRAESAKTFLVDSGVDPDRITTISYGEERPLDPGHNEEAWAKNRRAHFVIVE